MISFCNNVNFTNLQAEEYWSQASQDVDGMLGGFAHLHRPDITVSKSFISKLREKVGRIVESRYHIEFFDIYSVCWLTMNMHSTVVLA